MLFGDDKKLRFDIDELKYKIEEVNKKISTFQQNLLDFQNKLTLVNEVLIKTEKPQIESRLSELEAWKYKIHGLLTDKSPNTGKEKLSKDGKRFGGNYQAFVR